MSAPFIPFNAKSGYIEGTTCALADYPPKVKKLVPADMVGSAKFYGNLNGKNVYLYGGSDWDRVGFTFPNSSDEFSAATTSSIRVAMLTDKLGVVAYIVATKLYAKAFTIGGGGYFTFGSAVTVNDADTGVMPSICRVSDSTYAIAYVDDGGSDFVYVRMGSVSGTVITQGDESASMSAAAAANVDDGVGICMPRPTVLAVVWTSAADTFGYCTAVTFATTVVGTPGTAVEFATASQNSDIPSCCSHSLGYISVAYRDADNSNYLTINIGTVSAAGVVAFGGSEEALNASATTDIKIHSPRTNSMVISYLDASADPSLIAGGVVAGALTTFVQGAVVALTATGYTASVTSAILSPTEVAIAFCDDALSGDLGCIKRYTISWASTGAGTLTADSVLDIWLETSTKGACFMAATKLGEVVVGFADIDASSHGQLQYGRFSKNIMDIRSGTAAATYSLWISSIKEYVKTN